VWECVSLNCKQKSPYTKETLFAFPSAQLNTKETLFAFPSVQPNTMKTHRRTLSAKTPTDFGNEMEQTASFCLHQGDVSTVEVALGRFRVRLMLVGEHTLHITLPPSLSLSFSHLPPCQVWFFSLSLLFLAPFCLCLSFCGPSKGFLAAYTQKKRERKRKQETHKRTQKGENHSPTKSAPASVCPL
jgi:hypothetical protein